MKRRQCLCGRAIRYRDALCPWCLKRYGEDRDAWPEWLRFWVADTQRELDVERGHHEELFNEEWLGHVDDRYPSERPNDVGAAWSYIKNEMMPE